MKVLYVSHAVRDPARGAAYADLSLLAGLRARGHEVDEEWDIGAPRRIEHDNLHLLLEAPRKCVRAINRRLDGHDVVIVNQPLGWRAARELRLASRSPLFIARSHGWEPRVHEALAPYLERAGWLRGNASAALRTLLHRHNALLVKWADGIVLGSEEDRAFVIAKHACSPENTVAIAPGTPVECLRSPALPLTDERIRRILHVGQFAPFKAPEVVAAVLDSVCRERNEVTATWVCHESDHDAVRRLLSATALSRVKLVGWQTRESLCDIYDEHGLFLFPSHYEGFGQTFLEAMARGMVILATRVGGMEEAIRDGWNGYLFDPRRTPEIARQALALLDRLDEAREVGQRARKTVEGYTWTRSAQRLESFLAFQLGKRRGAA